MVVVILLALLQFFWRVEDDEPARTIAEGQEASGAVELEGGDVVLLQELLALAAVAEKL